MSDLFTALSRPTMATDSSWVFFKTRGLFRRNDKAHVISMDVVSADAIISIFNKKRGTTPNCQVEIVNDLNTTTYREPTIFQGHQLASRCTYSVVFGRLIDLPSCMWMAIMIIFPCELDPVTKPSISLTNISNLSGVVSTSDSGKVIILMRFGSLD